MEILKWIIVIIISSFVLYIIWTDEDKSLKIVYNIFNIVFLFFLFLAILEIGKILL